MENFINRTKKLSSFILDSNGSRVQERNTWVKSPLNFKRLSCTSFEEVFVPSGMTNTTVNSIYKNNFSVILYPCESQPPSCRISWQISPCVKVPGKTRKCKVVQHAGCRDPRAFSANIMVIEDSIIIWGTIKDDKEEGEDFELKLSVPDQLETFQQTVTLQGTLKRGVRKTDQQFSVTHDALVLAQS